MLNILILNNSRGVNATILFTSNIFYIALQETEHLISILVKYMHKI